MNLELFRADRTEPVDTAARLVAGYVQLTQVDEAIRAAQQRLEAAHLRCSQQRHGAASAEQIYAEILALRGRSRRMLAELAQIWVAER
jgi:hypothetical protein